VFNKQLTVALSPPLRLPETKLAVPRYEEPPKVILQTPVMRVSAVPELLRTSVHTSGVPLQFDPAEAETAAELVKVPRRPKKNPEIAVAAMRVMAMSITVARTGDIALFLSGERINFAEAS
jgi:hypothetical protein